jgi:hypothetical protein
MILTAPFRPLFQARTYRDLLFLAAAIPVAAVVLAVVIAGWTAVAVLAITPLVVPALVGYRGAIGLLARADAELARSLLEVAAAPPQMISSGGSGFWSRAKAVLVDESFWRQQAYLVLRMVVGFALAVAELSLIAIGAAWLVYPLWYRWADTSLGSWHFDTLGRSFLFVLAGLVALVAAGWLARLFAAISAWQVRTLLAGRPGPRSPRQRQLLRRRMLGYHAGVALALVLGQVVIWRSVATGYFWPEWVMLPLALVLAIHVWVEIVVARLRAADARALAIHAGVVAALVVFLTLVWAVTGRGYFWPGWVLLGLAIPLGIHALVAWARRLGRLARGVETPATARAGAVEE